MRGISRKWQNIVVMPNGVEFQNIDDACGTLFHTIADLVPVITLTWPPSRQPSLGTDGGQPFTHEFQLQLLHMGDVDRKWYLKQHEFTTSVQRCVSPSSSRCVLADITPGISRASRFSHSVSAKTRTPRIGATSTNAYHSLQRSFRILLCVSRCAYSHFHCACILKCAPTARSPHPSRTKVPRARASYRAACHRFSRAGGNARMPQGPSHQGPE
jgi:hypothetical protein